MKPPAQAPIGTKEDISYFLTTRHIAIIGLSRDPKSYSRALANTLRARNYVISGVNPKLETLADFTVFHHIADVRPTPHAALIILPPEQADSAALSCIHNGIATIWNRGIEHRGTLSSSVVNLAREQEIRLIDGYCPLMFLNHSGFPHNLHKQIYHWFHLEPK